MAYLEIGINEGWRLGPNTEVTEKGGIKLHFTKGTAVTSALEMMEVADDEIPDESTIFIFPPDTTNKDGSKKDAITMGKIMRSKYSTFRKIFKLYFTEKELLKDFPVTDIYKKFDIDKDNQEAMFTSDSVIKEMFKELGAMVINFIKKHNVSSSETFRIKLKRQSPKRAYPELVPFPERDDWIELMSSSPSKVKFTKWEESQGWDDASVPTDVVQETPQTHEGNGESVGDDVPEFENSTDEEFD